MAPSTPPRGGHSSPIGRKLPAVAEEVSSDPISDYLNFELQTPGQLDSGEDDQHATLSPVSDNRIKYQLGTVGSGAGEVVEGSESEWLGFKDPHYDTHDGDDDEDEDGRTASGQSSLHEEFNQAYSEGKAEAGVDLDQGIGNLKPVGEGYTLEGTFEDDGVDESDHVLAGFQTQAPAGWVSSLEE